MHSPPACPASGKRWKRPAPYSKPSVAMSIDVPTRHKFNRLAKRFSALAAEIKNLITPEN
jgi:hypothetical protein